MHKDEQAIRQLVATWLETRLSVIVTPKNGGSPIERAGNTLSILNKQEGVWLIARDANMLAPVEHRFTIETEGIR